jgi:DNA replication factor GINS
MGGGGDGASGGPTSDSRSDAAGTDGVREVDPDPAPPGSEGSRRDPSGDRPGTDGTDADAGGTAPIPGGGAPSGGAERVTVRITSDVDEFYGVDERRYDLDAEDVVQLPEANAKPLLQKEAAERLD